jgi:hypothetical protein
MIRNVWRFALLAVALLPATLCVALPAAESFPNEFAIHNQRQQAKQENEPNKNQSAAVDVTTPPNQFRGSKHEQSAYCYSGENEGDCASRIVQEGIARFYIWLVIAAIAQVVVGTLTVIAIFGQKSLSEKQLETFIATQQPVLDPVALASINLNIDTKKVGASFTIDVKNTGLTAAENVSLWVNAEFLAVRIGPNFRFAPPPFEVPDSSRIPPGRSANSGIMHVPQIALSGTIEKTGFYNLWGRCEYDDIFPGSKRHWISFCFEMEVIDDVFTIPFDRIKEMTNFQNVRLPKPIQFRIAKYGNESGQYDKPKAKAAKES